MKNLFMVTLVVLILVIIFRGKGKVNISKEVASEIVFGGDFSHYQGNVNWDQIKSQKKHPFEFFIFRATMGDDRMDTCFLRNFVNAKARGYTVGMYHIIHPNEDMRLQAKNFLRISQILMKGDFLPVIDIESLSDSISVDSLKKDLRWFLDTVEMKYKAKPILYTGIHFYKTYLQKEFADYPLWIAAYSEERRKDPIVMGAKIHQFAGDNIKVPGIKGKIDGNDIRRTAFDSLLIK